MSQLPFRAIIVDFDRTLLHTDKSISAYTIRVLREWREAGARLFAATARPERALVFHCFMVQWKRCKYERADRKDAGWHIHGLCC